MNALHPDSDALTEVPSQSGPSFSSLAANGPKVLWIVSSGGHLVQATHIERLIGAHPDSVWITNDVPQARSLLANRNVVYVDYVAPRDLRGAIRAAKIASRVAKEMSPDQIISTGAAIAGVALPRLAIAGHTTTFVESVARRTTRSLTGRISALSPRVRTLTQYADRANRRWAFDGTILANWERRGGLTGEYDDRPLRVFVTLGTIRPYRFDTAVEAMLKILRPDDEVVWQLGETSRPHLPGESHESMSNAQLRRHVDRADVVVSHAGVGTIVDTLEASKCPVLLVRRAERNEHVDDHQLDIAGELQQRGLGYELDLNDPHRDILLSASAARAVRVT
ncbi:MAG: glycosyltransferase [Microbacterium sp.]|jgi:UDP-N-acetylglucosamine transferase subunit ALG13|uniref:glycosyltransferase n=1 Tax=Microbacterium sp. TaxID=51671 RepID=UPI002608760B|nr:glycosyltransferase [Microbacterium sp.]MDF2561864.1 glycosyltransferase [Microbacterium sp.]